MVWNHLAAILLFSGPLFYLGLWMAIDPAGILALPEWLLGRFRRLVPDGKGEPEPLAISRRARTALRVAGVTLLLFAIVL